MARLQTLAAAIFLLFDLSLIVIHFAELLYFSYLQLLFPLLVPFILLQVVLLLIMHGFRKELHLLSIIALSSSGIVLMFFYGLPKKMATSEGAEWVLLNWNVQQFSNDTAKVEEALKFIRSVNPDVLLLQEFGLYYKWPDVQSVAEDFSKRSGLPYYDFSPHPNNIFGVACFSRYPIEHVDTVFQLLSHTNEAKVYHIALPGDKLLIGNGHLMSYNLFSTQDQVSWVGIGDIIQERMRQAELMAAHRLQLVVGDLNAVPGDAITASFERYFQDAFHGSLWPTHLGSLARIDHVYHTAETMITETRIHHHTISDHAALEVRFSLRP